MGLSDIGCAHFSPCEAAQLPLSPTPSLQPQESDDERNQLSCRVCWQSEVHEANLLSPCCCRGSQKHVHLKCLRRWQENVQKRDATDERAFRCSVCRALFSVPPPQPRATTVVVPLLRGVCALLCVALLTFGLSGPPWPHLALLLLLLLASRSHWLPGLALLTLCTVLAAMHARGLRIVLRVDGGGRLGVALIRHGAPVQGIAPGVLLVASEGLDHSMFKRSVVLLTQHGRQGARGVMLTQPMTTPPAAGHALVVDHAWADDARHGSEQPAGSNGTEADGGAEGRGSGGRRGQAQTHGGGAAREGGGLVMKHFLGGPVGMPGEGVNHEVLVLHSLAGVAGARRLLPADNDTRPAAGTTGAAAGSPAHGAAVAAADGDGAAVGELPEAFQLFEGGSIHEILAKGSDAASAAASAAAAAAASRAHSRRSGRPGMAREAAVAGGQSRDGVLPVLLFHGLCSWSEGQLEGELRAGAWGFVADPEPGMHSLLSLPPDQLWNALAGSANTARRA